MKKLRNLKHIFVISLIALTLIFGSIIIFSSEFSSSINGFFVYRTTGRVWQDRIYTHHLTPSSDIAIIAIDERTLNTLQASGDQKMLTIPKSTYTKLIGKLEGAGVKAIGIDIIFQNSDSEEQVFADTMATYDNIVIASMRYSGESCTPDSSGSGETCPGAPRSVYASVPWGIIDIDSAYIRPSRYDISRTPYQSWKTGSQLLMTLPIELAKIGGQSMSDIFPSRVLNPFFGAPSSYPSISFVDVLSMSRVELIANFSGKYILIGESGTLIHDSLVSPVTGTLMDGVELHAHYLDGLLQNQMLTRLGSNASFAVVIGLTILMVILYLLLPSYLSPIVAIVMMGGILYISRYLYDIERTLVDIFPLFLAGGLLTFPLTFVYRFFVVDRERRHIENAFGHYIDPKMVKMINMEEVELTLGGEQREVSVFFSDIAGFTTISETLGTRDLFYLMSSYLSRMTDILIREGGTLDKYIGDAVMGFFGAPVTQADHAIRACKTALEMRHILPEFNREIVSRGVAPIEFRVGIATGEVMVGNIGSTDHFNYTILGDTVNLASRLEAMGKEYGVHVIISGGTLAQVSDIFAVRELDTIAVKGKTEGVHIYELLGLLGYTTDSQIHETYAQALSLYRAGSYIEAGKLWESQMDQDEPSRIMALRCVEILEGRVEIIDGVYHMEHK